MQLEQVIKDKDSQIFALEAKIIAYQSELNLYQQRCVQFAEAYDRLQNQVHALSRNRFGKKSERFLEDPEHPQASLLEDNAHLFACADAQGLTVEDADNASVSSRKKKPRTKKELPRRIEIIPVKTADRVCACGACKTLLRYETKDLCHYQPAVHEIIEQRREVIACPKGCEGEIVTAPAPLQVLPKVKATEELLSFLITSKLEDRQPLYHLEKQLSTRHSVDISRQTMARWFTDLKLPLQPLYNLLKDEVIDHDVAACDATTLQVLNEPGRRAETKSYVYCMRGGPPEKSVILYDYNDRLHKQFVRDWFAGFAGYLHVDGDNFFENIGETTALVHCHAHARRKFEPLAKAAKGQGLAKEALRFFKALYRIERQAKNQNLSSAQRFDLRQRETKPLMEKFKSWLDTLYPTVLPKSPLGNAMHYCLKLWSGLTRFLNDGRLEVDNNLTEQEIKPLVMARKNFLFCASVAGAKALCMHLSLIRTAKCHGLDPYHYYVKILKALPHCKSVEDYEKLLPWNIKIENYA